MNDKKFENLILPSSLSKVKRLEPYLKTIQSGAGFGEEQYSTILLALNEAVTNAMEHGNKMDSSKKVTISARVDKNTLRVAVQDEGSGYNPDDIPDPTAEENLLKESGRGLFFIRQYTDKVKFEDQATKLIMYFSLQE